MYFTVEAASCVCSHTGSSMAGMLWEKISQISQVDCDSQTFYPQNLCISQATQFTFN